jgi:hypothetical protein
MEIKMEIIVCKVPNTNQTIQIQCDPDEIAQGNFSHIRVMSEVPKGVDVIELIQNYYTAKAISKQPKKDSKSPSEKELAIAATLSVCSGYGAGVATIGGTILCMAESTLSTPLISIPIAVGGLASGFFCGVACFYSTVKACQTLDTYYEMKHR